MLQQREAMTSSEAKQKGAAITSRLLQMDLYLKAQCLGCYVSVQKEVDTHALIQTALDEAKQLSVPVIGKKPKMRFIEIQNFSELKPASFGLLEPSGADQTEIPPNTFDLIIVPGLAFDRQGNRIGFGAGYYDWFLAQVNAPKVALTYDFQIQEHLSTEPHDIRIDFLVTETDICVCDSGR